MSHVELLAHFEKQFSDLKKEMKISSSLEELDEIFYLRDMILKEIDDLPPVIKKDVKIPKPLEIYEAQGCKQCKNTGYSGRVALYEILEMTNQLAEIILKEPTESKIQEEAHRQGMITMKQDGILKVLTGLTSMEEVLSAAEDKESNGAINKNVLE